MKKIFVCIRVYMHIHAYSCTGVNGGQKVRLEAVVSGLTCIGVEKDKAV